MNPYGIFIYIAKLPDRILISQGVWLLRRDVTLYSFLSAVWRLDPSVNQMPSQDQQRKTLTALLIVDHLPRHFFDEELAALVRPFGTVLSTHVMRDGAGDHLDFGYVELDTLENARCAMCALNGHEVHGHAITVALVIPPCRAA